MRKKEAFVGEKGACIEAASKNTAHIHIGQEHVQACTTNRI